MNSIRENTEWNCDMGLPYVFLNALIFSIARKNLLDFIACLKVVEYIMESLEDKNPKSEEDENCYVTTPLELATDNEKWKVCEFILENVPGILDPKAYDWNDTFDTPFTIAAKIGNLKLCQIILDNVDKEEDLEKVDSYCKSACSEASEQGHWNVVVMIGNYCKNKFKQNV